MRHLPRALNRTLLFLLGIVLIAAGALIICLPLVEQVRQYWQNWGPNAWQWYQHWANQLRINDQISWLQVAYLALALLALIFLLVWIFKQGGGKTAKVATLASKSTSGTATAEVSLIDAILQQELATDRLISGVSTSAWRVKKDNGIKIKVVAAKGADVEAIHAAATNAVAKLDSLLGRPVPVMLHITTGWIQKSQSRTD